MMMVISQNCVRSSLSLSARTSVLLETHLRSIFALLGLSRIVTDSLKSSFTFNLIMRQIKSIDQAALIKAKGAQSILNYFFLYIL